MPVGVRQREDSYNPSERVRLIRSTRVRKNCLGEKRLELWCNMGIIFLQFKTELQCAYNKPDKLLTSLLWYLVEWGWQFRTEAGQKKTALAHWPDRKKRRQKSSKKESGKRFLFLNDEVGICSFNFRQTAQTHMGQDKERNNNFSIFIFTKNFKMPKIHNLS